MRESKAQGLQEQEAMNSLKTDRTPWSSYARAPRWSGGVAYEKSPCLVVLRPYARGSEVGHDPYICKCICICICICIRCMCMCVYVYIYIYTYVYAYIYIYSLRQQPGAANRQRALQRKDLSEHTHTCICIYIYIYIYFPPIAGRANGAAGRPSYGVVFCGFLDLSIRDFRGNSLWGWEFYPLRLPATCKHGWSKHGSSRIC